MNEINENTQLNEIPANLEPASMGVLEASNNFAGEVNQEYTQAFQKNPRRRKWAPTLLGRAGMTAAVATGIHYGKDPVNQAYTKVAGPTMLLEMYENFINPRPRTIDALGDTAERLNLIKGTPEEREGTKVLLKLLYNATSSGEGDSGVEQVVNDNTIIKGLTDLMQHPRDIEYSRPLEGIAAAAAEARGMDPEKLRQTDIESVSQTLFGQSQLPENAYINTFKNVGDLGVKLSRELSFAKALRAIPRALGWDEGVKHADDISLFLYSNPVLFLGGLGAGAMYTSFRLNRFLRNRDRRKAAKFFESRNAGFSNSAELFAA